MIFHVSEKPDAGDFRDGRLAWDILRVTARHDKQLPTCVDLSKAPHLKPYAVAALYAVALRQDGGSVEIIRPDNQILDEHLSRIGLYHAYGIEQSGTRVRETNVPVRQLKDGPATFSSEAMDIWDRELNGTAPGLKLRLADHLDEIILNSLHHSESPIGCIVAGQAFPQTSKVEVAVLDLGQTIRGHLSKHPSYGNLVSDEDAIIEATKEGVTGTIGTENSGVGLYELRQFCEAGFGELAIISGRSIGVFRQGEDPVFHPFHGSGFSGTLVNMRFSTNPALTVSRPDGIVW